MYKINFALVISGILFKLIGFLTKILWKLGFVPVKYALSLSWAIFYILLNMLTFGLIFAGRKKNQWEMLQAQTKAERFLEQQSQTYQNRMGKHPTAALSSHRADIVRHGRKVSEQIFTRNTAQIQKPEYVFIGKKCFVKRSKPVSPKPSLSPHSAYQRTRQAAAFHANFPVQWAGGEAK